ncbi:MAG: hypothetical protein E7268_06810 [Lachnospiraceae bacterium]|nr:hypothetical protein [Lachnospiraceae bacterium]
MGKSVILKKIEKVTEEQIQTALFAGLALFVLVFPLAKYIWTYHVRANQVQEIFLILLMLYFLAVLGIEYRNKKIPLRNIAAWAIIGMTVFGFISCVWNGDYVNGIYGDDFQGEGLITLVSYYALFFAAAHLKKKEYRRWLFGFICLSLGFIALYGILQFFHVPFMIHNVIKAAILPTRNQNYYAAFPVLFLGLLFGIILYEEAKGNTSGKNMIIWHVLVMIGYGACIGSDSMLVYIGLIMQFLLMIFLECFRKEKRFGTIFLFLVEFAVVFGIFDLLSGGQANEELFSLTNQIKQEGTILGDSVGSGRMKIWKETLKLIPKDWAFGCGLDKFVIDCGTAEAPYLYSDAHNEYLQMWAEQGFFVVASYLVFLFSLFIPGCLQFIKKEEYDSDFVSKAAMFAFFGYIAQAFANIRVLQVAPYFWLCCGLLYVRKRQNKKNEKESEETGC